MADVTVFQDSIALVKVHLPDAHADEYVQLRNGNTRFDVSGIRVYALGADKSFTFPPGTVLEPNDGEVLIFSTGVAVGKVFSFGSPTPFWRPDGDVARVFNQHGILLAELTYGHPSMVEVTEGGNAVANGGSVDMGTIRVGGEVTKTFTLRNTGEKVLQITSLAIDDTINYSISPSPLARDLDSGASLTFTVTFSPKSAATTTPKVTLASDAPEGKFAFNLRGVGEVVNPLKNGSFEEGVPIPSVYVSPSVGDSTSITYWVVSRGAIDYCQTLQWDAADGSRSLDLNSYDVGGIKQTFETRPGATYTVKFAFAGNPGGAPVIEKMRVEITPSSSPQSADFECSVAGRGFRNMGWTYKTWSFTAQATATTIEFYSLVGGPYGPTLDDVSVTMNP